MARSRDLHMGELVPEEGALHRGAPTRQGGHELGLLLPEAPLGQAGQGRRVRLALDQRRQHGTARDPQDVGGDRAQLQVRCLQELLDAVRLIGPRPDELLPVAGGLPQVADGGRGDEAPAQQAVLEELRDPLGIQGILLPAGQGLDVLRVDHEDLLEVPLQDVADGLPVDPRALHRHMGAARGHQPVEEDQELSRGGPEGPQLLRHTAAAPQPPQAGGDAVLVHVEAAADAVQDLHGAPPLPEAARRGVHRSSSLRGVLPPWGARQSEVPKDRPGHTQCGLAAPVKSRPSLPSCPPEYRHSGAHFHPLW